jgi:hypothetical protein
LTLLEEVVAVVQRRVALGEEPLVPAECHYLAQACEALRREPEEPLTPDAVAGLAGAFDNGFLTFQSTQLGS